MSSTDIENFIQALEAVKQDYTCGVCFELCKEPITLSKCFHIICSEHFADLKSCPNCDTSLQGCTQFSDDRLGSCIESARELSKMVAGLGKTVGKSSKTSEQPVKLGSASTKDSPRPVSAGKLAKSDRTIRSKAEAGKSNANESLLSVSSRINKAIEKNNNKGETLLHIACRLGKVDRITELLNQGANTNTKDNAGWTPLHEVVQNGRLDLVRLLLQHNTLINVPGPDNETPLHEAVRYQHEDIVEELVKNGADINIRNCKGETPYQLAGLDMKNLMMIAADNIIQTQSVNISHIAALYSEMDSDDIHVYCVSKFRSVHSKLKALLKHHSNIHLEAKFTKKVTHLIVDVEEDGSCLSSVDILQGVLNSVWVLSSQWIIKSTEDKLEPFDKHEVKGIGPKMHQGPKTARYNKYKQLPGLFDGCHFYLHNFNTKYEISAHLAVTKPVLSKLIVDAGGVVLRRVPNPESIPEQEKLVPYHAMKHGKLVNCSHYIIFKDMYQPMYNMQHIKALPVGWLIECMERYELCDP